MASDQEIAKCLETILRQSDPNSFTTFNGVVQQLEAKLGLDLSQKAGFIRDQINFLLRSHPPQPLPPRDHFALQHHPQFPNTHPQFHSHFALQHHQHQHQHQHQQQHQQQQHQHRPEYNLNFLNPFQQLPQAKPPAQPQRRQPQVQPALVIKNEANVQDVKTNVSDSPKESAPAKRRGGPGGLYKVCGVTPELQAIVGEPALPRTEIVKQLWAYIRKNNLQDPSNKRKIICDDALRVVFETDCTDMFKMNKLLSKHIIRLEPKKESGRSKKLKVEVESPTENTEPGPPPPPPLVIISEALANFFGTGEREVPQSEVLRRIWEYIKVNNLEDPLNSMVILCDAKLRQLLGCESISALGIPEMLARHHLFKR